MKDTVFYPNDDQKKRLATIYGKTDGKLTAVPNALIGLPPHPKHPIPAGGLVSSGADLAKLYRMMLHKGELDGRRILSAKAVADMTQVQTGDIKTGFVEGMSFGYGWAVVREPKGVTGMLSAARSATAARSALRPGSTRPTTCSRSSSSSATGFPTRMRLRCGSWQELAEGAVKP